MSQFTISWIRILLWTKHSPPPSPRSSFWFLQWPSRIPCGRKGEVWHVPGLTKLVSWWQFYVLARIQRVDKRLNGTRFATASKHSHLDKYNRHRRPLETPLSRLKNHPRNFCKTTEHHRMQCNFRTTCIRSIVWKKVKPISNLENRDLCKAHNCTHAGFQYCE